VNRNIYFLRLGAPPKLIVNFPGDDGQELTTPAVSNTGGAVAFVRGATSNPTSLPDPPEAEVWIVSTKGGVTAATRTRTRAGVFRRRHATRLVVRRRRAVSSVADLERRQSGIGGQSREGASHAATGAGIARSVLARR
jgi:hypothetical protein